MKKLFVFLLAVVLCFALCACGGRTETDSDTQQAIQAESTGTERPVVVVGIAINPEFNIHVGNDGNVIALDCLNADAKSVSDKVSVIGKPCKDAIVEILQETVNQGFLKDGGEIKISVTVDEEISDQLDTWNDTVMDSVTQVLTANNINAEISFSSDNMETENEGSIAPLPPGLVLSSTDANGNMIIETDRGFITLDKNGKRIEEVYTADDGTVITLKYDENEKMIEAVHAQTGGTVITESYDKNGNITFQRNEFTDGSWTEQTFENGSLTKEIRENPGGKNPLRTETEYYTNGNIKSSYTYYYSDSSYCDVKYNENGTKSYEYNYVNSSKYTERTYDGNGNLLTDNSMDSDGTGWEITYNPDGSHYGYTYYPDGSVWYNEWDSNDVQDLSAQKQIK